MSHLVTYYLAVQGWFTLIARYQQIPAALRESSVFYDVGEMQKSFLEEIYCTLRRICNEREKCFLAYGSGARHACSDLHFPW